MSKPFFGYKPSLFIVKTGVVLLQYGKSGRCPRFQINSDIHCPLGKVLCRERHKVERHGEQLLFRVEAVIVF